MIFSDTENLSTRSTIIFLHHFKKMTLIFEEKSTKENIIIPFVGWLFLRTTGKHAPHYKVESIVDLCGDQTPLFSHFFQGSYVFYSLKNTEKILFSHQLRTTHVLYTQVLFTINSTPNYEMPVYEKWSLWKPADVFSLYRCDKRNSTTIKACSWKGEHHDFLPEIIK